MTKQVWTKPNITKVFVKSATKGSIPGGSEYTVLLSAGGGST